MIFESQNLSLVLRDQIVVLQMLILAQAVQKLVVPLAVKKTLAVVVSQVQMHGKLT